MKGKVIGNWKRSVQSQMSPPVLSSEINEIHMRRAINYWIGILKITNDVMRFPGSEQAITSGPTFYNAARTETEVQVISDSVSINRVVSAALVPSGSVKVNGPDRNWTRVCLPLLMSVFELVRMRIVHGMVNGPECSSLLLSRLTIDD